MRATLDPVNRRIRALLLAAAVAVLGLAGLGQAAPAAATVPLCQQNLPAAGSGTLTLDRGAVAPASTVVGVISGLTAWPVYLFGGSGETFSTCTPWTSVDGHTEAMAHDAAAYFLISVPATAQPGSYPIEVVFSEGGTALTPGTLVRLEATLEVNRVPSAVTGTTGACRQSHAAATTGTYAGPGAAVTGGQMAMGIFGLDPRAIHGIDFTSGLTYLACLAGQATPITGLPRSGAPFHVSVPDNLSLGGHSIVIIGADGAGGLRQWRSVVLIRARPHLILPADPVPAGSVITVSGNCDRTPVVTLISGAFDTRGEHDWTGPTYGVLLPGTDGVWRFPTSGPLGDFSGQVLLRSSAVGQYPVTLRCSGGLSMTTSVTVTAALAATGSPARTELVTGLISLSVGLALAGLASRRRLVPSRQRSSRL